MMRRSRSWHWIPASWSIATFALSNLFVAAAALSAEPLQNIGELKLQGQWDQSTAISAIAFSEDQKLLFLAADEDGGVYVFRATPDPLTYSWARTIDIRKGTNHEDDEADLEGLSVSGPWLYVIGSHSMKRESVKETKSRASNRERHLEVKEEKGRRVLARFKTKQALEPEVEIERVKLWPRLEEHSLLNRFSQIPSKENGLDIEGIAVDGDQLLLGFRSPVLRDGYAISIETVFKNDAGCTPVFLSLKGQGIRDLTRLKTGQFLLLAGPSAESGTDYRLMLWNGKDTTSGNDGPAEGELVQVGAIPVPGPKGKAEGLAVLRQSSSGFDIVVVYDGLPGGQPTIFRCMSPNQ